MTWQGSAQHKVLCHFNKLSLEDGLTSQTYNHHIFQDSDAFIWINSQLGLNRYDGQKIITYKATDDTLSLLDNGLNSPFFEDSSNKLWFSSRRAIYQFDPVWQTFTPFSLVPQTIDTIYDYQLKLIDKEIERAWARIKNKLYTFELDHPDSATLVWESPRINYRSVVSRDKVHNKAILFSHTSNGMIIKDLDSPKIKNDSVSQILTFTNKKVFTSLHTADTIVWVGLREGLGLVKLYSDTINSRMINSSVKNIVGIAQLEPGHLIVATQKEGIYLYNVASNQYVGQIYSIERDRTVAFKKEIEYIYIAPDRTLWLSSQSNGVFFTHLDKVKFDPYFLRDYKDIEHSSGVKAVTEDTVRRLWGVSEYEVFIWDSLGTPLQELYDDINKPRAFNNNKIFTIYSDQHSRIWIGTQLGLYLYNEDLRHFELFPIVHTELSQMPTITSIQELHNGQLLVCTAGEGVIEIHVDPQWEGLVAVPWIKDQRTYNWLYQIDSTRLVINQYGHSLDFYEIKATKPILQNRITHNAEFAGLVGNAIEERIWIPADDGLFYLNTEETPYQIKEDSTFSGLAIQGLLLDKAGALWLSTHFGLMKYSEEDKEVKEYYAAHGVQGPEFEFASFKRTRNNRLVFGGILGVTVFNPETFREIFTPAEPIINDISIRGLDKQDIRDHKTGNNNPTTIQDLVLPYSLNKSLSFSFAPRSYGDPGRASFRYQLIRNNRDTVDNSIEANPRFVDLRNGSYLLQVIAWNSDGVSNHVPYQIRFKILPPWYITWWAIVLYILLFSYTLYRLYRIRIKQVEKKEAEKRREAEFRQKEAEFRQKEAEYKQLVAETETAILRLQMNPHFLFNSMNSINSYILQRDIDTASHYLTHFAKLMRQILELSEHPSMKFTRKWNS